MEQRIAWRLWQHALEARQRQQGAALHQVCGISMCSASRACSCKEREQCTAMHAVRSPEACRGRLVSHCSSLHDAAAGTTEVGSVQSLAQREYAVRSMRSHL